MIWRAPALSGERIVMMPTLPHARPMALSYSPLDALNPGVLTESIEIGFDSVVMK